MDVADRNTREWLHQVIEILLEYVRTSNDRSKKILDFHHPDQLKEVIDLEIPEKPLNLDQLLVDCKDTMKYGVKTGKYSTHISLPISNILPKYIIVPNVGWSGHILISNF